MKNLVISLSLLLVLIGFGAFVFMKTAEARNDLITDLLNLPAPPPPNPLFQTASNRERAENFYSKKTPPDDDAPIEDLLDYWRAQSTAYEDPGYNIEPSDKVLERLMAEIEKNPENLTGLINVLPDTPEAADVVKRIYDATSETSENDIDSRSTMRDWLKYHSAYFSDELLEGSRGVGDSDEYVTNQDELLALASVDFSKAQPILNRLYNDSSQPVSQTLARWALYRHAIETDSLGDIERYRDELKAVVENKSAGPGQRDLALDALTKEEEWPGRDDWYYGLLGDETLADLKVNGQTYTGLTTMISYAPPEKYLDRMLELLKSNNPAVRDAAIRNLGLLISKDHPEVVEALLPWLENPKWAKEKGNERYRLVSALQNLKLPASVPGLIETLSEKQTRFIASENYSSNSNRPVVTSGTERVSTLDYYALRDPAITALSVQRDMRAVPALRRALTEVDEYERMAVIRALYFSNGFSIPEQVDALETSAREAGEAEQQMPANSNSFYAARAYPYRAGNTANYRVRSDEDEASDDGPPPPPPAVYTANSNVSSYDLQRPLSGDDIKSILGSVLVENTEAEEPLVMAVIDRIAVLERKEPRVAGALKKILQTWKGPAINAMMLRDLKNGKGTVDSIVKLLSLRKELAEKQTPAVYDTRDGGPLAAGIAACILGDNAGYDSILSGDNAEMKTAMLACARLVRADLPADKVAALMGNQNKTLALAAERYLESNDTPEARAVVLSFHPNEARILGATTYFAPGDDPIMGSDFLPDLFQSVPGGVPVYPYHLTSDFLSNIKGTEKKLQKEVRENVDLIGVYAYNDNFIRIFKDRAVFSWEEDPARYRERVLTQEEFDGFKDLLASNRVDSLPPFLSESEEDEGNAPSELLMLGRQGGRRVFRYGGQIPEFFQRLDTAFEEMRKPPAKLHYWLEKEIPGLEILFADENLHAQAVWKNGGDLRVMVEDQALLEQINKEIGEQERAAESVENYDYEKGSEINQKRRLARMFEHLSWRKYSEGKVSELASSPPGIDLISPDGNATSWKSRSATVELRVSPEGLFKVTKGQATRIHRGTYSVPVIAPNGRWAVVTSYEEGGRLYRINLLTNKQFEIALPGYYPLGPVAFLPSQNRFLLAAGSPGEDEGGSGTIGSLFLLDPETGALQPVRSEARPLAEQTYRPLQATAVPDEFWAAISDGSGKETQIGIYNARTLSFKSMQKIPRISFSSMDMWVDEKENKIYIVYMGHLLSLPLKK